MRDFLEQNTVSLDGLPVNDSMFVYVLPDISTRLSSKTGKCFVRRHRRHRKTFFDRFCNLWFSHVLPTDVSQRPIMPLVSRPACRLCGIPALEICAYEKLLLGCQVAHNIPLGQTGRKGENPARP